RQVVRFRVFVGGEAARDLSRGWNRRRALPLGREVGGRGHPDGEREETAQDRPTHHHGRPHSTEVVPPVLAPPCGAPWGSGLKNSLDFAKSPDDGGQSLRRRPVFTPVISDI